jgi:tetratricopeptide (TPR) repeat protein
MSRTRSIGPAFVFSLLLTACGGNAPDTTPPEAVRGVEITATGSSIRVRWLPNYAVDLSHYLLYQGTRPDSLWTGGHRITSTWRDVYSLTIGTRYHFGVTAVDEAGNESVMSEVVEVTPVNAAWETQLGWTAFQAEDYSGALYHFYLARELDPDHAPAYLGEGWSRAYVGLLNSARTSLEQAQSLGLATQDARAGLAVVLKLLGESNGAIAAADTVLTYEPAYVFTWRSSIDWRDLRLLMAQCWYRLGEPFFEQVQTQVDLLDPGNGLAPQDPGSWTVDGVLYESYAVALLMELMILETVIGG